MLVEAVLQECDFLLTSARYLEVLMWDALVFTNSHSG